MQSDIKKLTDILFKELENIDNTTQEKNDKLNATAKTLNTTLKIKLQYENLKANSNGIIP